MVNRHSLTALLVGFALGACNRDAGSAAPARPGLALASTIDSATAAALVPQHVDSALPREVELARFRADLGAAPATLSGGTSTRDALVSAYVRALRARDTLGLKSLGMSKAEFAWLYYPDSPIGKPPYDLSPGLMWFQMEGNGSKGLTHAMSERGGIDLHVIGYSCDPVETQGKNRLHKRCMLRRMQAPGDTVSELLFGGILERDGRFKFISFANKL